MHSKEKDNLKLEMLIRKIKNTNISIPKSKKFVKPKPKTMFLDHDILQSMVLKSNKKTTNITKQKKYSTSTIKKNSKNDIFNIIKDMKKYKL